MREEYWAASDSESIASEMAERIKKFRRYFEESGMLAVCRRAVRAYYGCDPSGGWAQSSAVTFSGESAEKAQLVNNHFRSLIDSRIVMTTSARPAFKCIPTNSNYKSVDNARLAEAILERDLGRGGLEISLRGVVKREQIYSEAWLMQTWDPDAGEEYAAGEPDPLTGIPAIVKQGDIAERILSPIDVIRDTSKRDRDHQWVIVRYQRNRYDLVKQYPDLAEDILNTERDRDSMLTLWEETGSSAESASDSDQVDVYELFHVRTPALPGGRHALICGDRVLLDGDIEYDWLPLSCMAEDTKPDMAFGHGTGWDLIAPQEVLNSIDCAVLTNHETFSIQSLWVKPGSGLNTDKLSSGLVLIESNEKPEPLQMTQISEHSYKIRQQQVSDMQTNSGVNSVNRGNPDANINSGSYAALVASMAIQANSGLQAAYVKLMEDACSKRIRLYQQFADYPRLVDTLGDDERFAIERFTKDRLTGVKGVTVTVGNPIMRDANGRREIADKLLNAQSQGGPLINAQQYLEVMDTGLIKPAYHYNTAEIRFIRWENQQLIMTGTEGAIPVKAFALENHPLHIQEHMAELVFDPSIRQNPAVMQAALAHIKEHETFNNVSQGMSPDGTMPPQPEMAEGGDVPAGGGESSPGGAPGAPPAGPLPRQPINPLTGARPQMPTSPGQSAPAAPRG